MCLEERERELVSANIWIRINEYNMMQRVAKGMSFIIKKEKVSSIMGKIFFPMIDIFL